MATAFVLSGGASLGSIQAGMAMALTENGIEPDVIVGTSVGAINGAFLASGHPATALADIWRGLRRQDLFPLRPLAGFRGFIGRRSHVVPNTGLRRLLEHHVSFGVIENAAIPLIVIATEAQSGAEVAIDHGPVVPAILASAALPGVFPPIEIDGRLLIDGGIVNNTAITRAIEGGATEVWVLSPGYSCALTRPPRGALAMAMHSIALLVQQRLVLETAARHYPVPVHLIPPPCPITVTPIDFSQSSQLIERALAGTRQWLGNGCPFAMPLLPHDHGIATN